MYACLSRGRCNGFLRTSLRNISTCTHAFGRRCASVKNSEPSPTTTALSPTSNRSSSLASQWLSKGHTTTSVRESDCASAIAEATARSREPRPSRTSTTSAGCGKLGLCMRASAHSSWPDTLWMLGTGTRRLRTLCLRASTSPGSHCCGHPASSRASTASTRAAIFSMYRALHGDKVQVGELPMVLAVCACAYVRACVRAAHPITFTTKHTHTHTPSLARLLFLFLTLCRSFTHTLTHTHTLSLSHTHTLTHTHTHSHTHTLSLTHTHSHTHTHTLSLSLSL